MDYNSVTKTGGQVGASDPIFRDSQTGVGDIMGVVVWEWTASGQTASGTIELTQDGTNWVASAVTLAYTSTTTSGKLVEKFSAPIAGPWLNARVNWANIGLTATVQLRRA